MMRISADHVARRPTDDVARHLDNDGQQ